MGMLLSSSCLSVWMTLLLTLAYCPTGNSQGGKKIHHLQPNHPLLDIADDDFHIFCRKGDSKKLINYFKSATLRIVSAADDIKIVKGYDDHEVYRKYLETTRWILWAQNLLPWRVREATFPTFNSSCVGVGTSKPYTAILIIRAMDTWSMFMLLGGICLFFFAPKMARSTTFFYASSTTLGSLGFALLLLFILYRILPRGRTAQVILSGLWLSSLYAAGETWNRFGDMVQEKLPYIVVYLTCGAVIAFIMSYRIGPPVHPRTLDIVTWVLQGVSLVLIHLSSDLIEISTLLILCVLSYHYCGQTFFYGIERWWRRRFPPSPKLLTEEEYITQGAEETAKSLEELRKFCNSPDCNSWKIVTRLRDPKRFSGFITGDSHLSDSEMMDYESDVEESEIRGGSQSTGNGTSPPITDDEDFS